MEVEGREVKLGQDGNGCDLRSDANDSSFGYFGSFSRRLPGLMGIRVRLTLERERDGERGPFVGLQGS